MFFSLDGADGGGKTTQLSLFCDWLRSSGYDVVACRDPGSTRLGDAIRHILLEGESPSGGNLPIARRSEMLLYMAARAQLVEEVIAPALKAGKTVVSDRFLLANVVYQGYAGGLDLEAIRQVGAIATAGVEPTLTFVLDAPEDVAASRLDRPLDRMERQGDAFRQRSERATLPRPPAARIGSLWSMPPARSTPCRLSCAAWRAGYWRTVERDPVFAFALLRIIHQSTR